jgi:hypothetical protein
MFDFGALAGSQAGGDHFPLSLSWLAPHAPLPRSSSTWLWRRANERIFGDGGSCGGLAREGETSVRASYPSKSLTYLYHPSSLGFFCSSPHSTPVEAPSTM